MVLQRNDVDLAGVSGVSGEAVAPVQAKVPQAAITLAGNGPLLASVDTVQVQRAITGHGVHPHDPYGRLRDRVSLPRLVLVCWP